jgi:hypothetical protein
MLQKMVLALMCADLHAILECERMTAERKPRIDALDPAAIRAQMRRTDRACADEFVRACKLDDPRLLLEAADNLINKAPCRGWDIALRKIGREIHVPLSAETWSAFLKVWSETQNLGLSNNPVLCSALRVLLPPYQGPAVQLFRGASARERARQCYRVSWTSDREVAEHFAQLYRVDESGSVLLETFASPEAILCDVTAAGGSYGEAEFLVDRRHLGRVHVISRYPSTSDLEHELSLEGQRVVEADQF